MSQIMQNPLDHCYRTIIFASILSMNSLEVGSPSFTFSGTDSVLSVLAGMFKANIFAGGLIVQFSEDLPSFLA